MVKLRFRKELILDRHRIAEVALMIGDTAAVEADKLGILGDPLDLVKTPFAGQNTQVSRMAVFVFAVLFLVVHIVSPELSHSSNVTACACPP